MTACHLARSSHRLAAAALVAGAALLWTPAVQAQGGPPASPVHVDEVTRAPLAQTAPVIGRVVARRAGPVAARIDGAVADFLVEVGDRVNAGQTMVLIDDAVLAARRDLAAARLAEAEAQVATKRAALGLARQELQRIEGLRTSAAFSQARFDDQRQTVAIAGAELNEAESAQASAAAELELADLNVYYAEIRAPYDGVVTARHTEAGAFLRGGEPVVDMVAVDALEIDVEVPFSRVGALQPGDTLSVSLADGSTHSAEVRAVVPNENPRTRTRPVRLTPDFGETGTPLVPGQSVTVEVPVGAAREVLSVAKDAVLPRAGGRQQVFVVEDGTASLRDVRLGVAVGDRFEVLEGLAAGDLAVVRGNERLRDGQSVNPVNRPKAGEPDTAQTAGQG